jgi:hypothetical protein
MVLLAAPKDSNPGVPAGWSAIQYDNYGNDLLNKNKPAVLSSDPNEEGQSRTSDK